MVDAIWLSFVTPRMRLIQWSGFIIELISTTLTLFGPANLTPQAIKSLDYFKDRRVWTLHVGNRQTTLTPYNSPTCDREAQQKRFVMQFRQQDGPVSGAELIVAGPADEARSPMESYRRNKSGRSDQALSAGPFIASTSFLRPGSLSCLRDVRSTETRIGETSGLKISELQNGDVLILYPLSP